MTKILAVGATGMLWEASATWHEQGHAVTLLARSRSRVASKLEQLIRQPPPDFIEVDYHDLEGLADALGTPHECVVAWIHGSAPDALDVILESTKPDRLIHVLGSAVADPSSALAERYLAHYAPRVELYQQVILGFERRKSGSTRWLTDEEIAQGVLDAWSAPRDTRVIVGMTRPWSERP